LAYYAVFAMIPMIYLSLISFGSFVGQDTMLSIIDKLLRDEVGLTDSSGVMNFLKEVNFEKGSLLMNIVGIVALLLSSSAMLASLRTSINEFFDIEITFEDKRKMLAHHMGTRLANILLLPVLGVVVVVTYFGQTVVLSTSREFFGDLNQFEVILLDLLQHGLAILTNVVLFAVIFKFLHDGNVRWKLAFAGAWATAILLYLGQLLIHFYLKNYFFGSSVGVPGTLLVILAWMYYSSQIIFLGAKFTKVYAEKAGSPIVFQPTRMNAKHIAGKVNRTIRR